MRLWSLAFVFLGLLGCIDDRKDLDRCVEDTNLTPQETDSPETDTGSGSSTQVSTAPDTDTNTDWSCFLSECKKDEECDCMPSTMCPDQGPPFIKFHCLVVDCEPSDPSTCPPNIPCIDATSLSAGVLSWVCFKMD
ncbi:MAG: hypothetical protein MUC50_02895 [Myxococcota bacterium]|jgi:hypothetical protein|nr:hypothetical protein [Myxococcota bacterium]